MGVNIYGLFQNNQRKVLFIILIHILLADASFSVSTLSYPGKMLKFFWTVCGGEGICLFLLLNQIAQG